MSWVNDITKIQQNIALSNAMRRSGVNDLLNNANKHMDSVIKERNSKRKLNIDKKVPTTNNENAALESYKQKIEAKMRDTKSLIDMYRLKRINQERLRELLDLRGEEHKKLLAANDGIVGDVYTNKRRVEYQTPELSTLKKYRFLIIIVYYLTMCMILIHKYMSNKKLDFNRNSLLAICLYLLLPLFLDDAVIRSYDVFDVIQRFSREKTPRNVYVNL